MGALVRWLMSALVYLQKILLSFPQGHPIHNFSPHVSVAVGCKAQIAIHRRKAVTAIFKEVKDFL
jgi:hypothetical protein